MKSAEHRTNKFCECGEPATTTYHNANVCERCKQIDRNMYQDAKAKDERKASGQCPCGCGNEVKPNRTYASSACANRHHGSVPKGRRLHQSTVGKKKTRLAEQYI